MDALLFAHLTEKVGLHPKTAKEYTDGLIEEGFETPDAFDGLSLQELQNDFGFKKGHLLAVEKYRAATPRPAPGSPIAPQFGQPAGSTLSDGSTIRVHMDQKLGQGGSGVVYKGLLTRRSGTTEEIAAKMLGAGASEREHQKFAQEFELLRQASQQCPGVCRVYGVIRCDGALCIIMKMYPQSIWDLLDGRVDAADPTKRVPLPLADALILALPVARAVAGLHKVDIRMQDLKPSNLLMDEDGQPVVSDFGIAKLEGATITSAPSRSGQGTPNYMAPELFSGQGITNKVDVWAFGAVFVQMITGTMPWAGLTVQQVIRQVDVMRKPIPVPPGLPSALGNLLTSCFAFDPASRPTASQLVETLRPLAEAEQTPQQLLLMHANSNLQGSWVKRELYTFSSTLDVKPCHNPALEQRYEAYKAKVAAENAGEAEEHLLFHGCSAEALHSIQREGFLKQYWRTAAGEWQRFGPGFYFALQSSKSHEYPMEQMKALPPGAHTRSMLMCKVVKGKMHRTEVNMDTLQGAPPGGCHSVYGVATPNGPLNYDELVVYNEAAILPHAVVTYRFVKHVDGAGAFGEGPAPEPETVAEELFQVLKTGQLMNKEQLFDAGITKAECCTIGQAADTARSTLGTSLAGATANADILQQGLSTIDQVLSDLASNRAAVDAQIDTEMAAAKQMVVSCIDKRAAELKATVAKCHDRSRRALVTQRADVAQRHEGQVRLCTQGAAAIQQDDRTVLELLASVHDELKAAAAGLGAVVPEASAEFKSKFDVAGVGGAAVEALAALGVVHQPPPPPPPPQRSNSSGKIRSHVSPPREPPPPRPNSNVGRATTPSPQRSNSSGKIRSHVSPPREPPPPRPNSNEASRSQQTSPFIQSEMCLIKAVREQQEQREAEKQFRDQMEKIGAARGTRVLVNGKPGSYMQMERKWVGGNMHQVLLDSGETVSAKVDAIGQCPATVLHAGEKARSIMAAVVRRGLEFSTPKIGRLPAHTVVTIQDQQETQSPLTGLNVKRLHVRYWEQTSGAISYARWQEGWVSQISGSGLMVFKAEVACKGALVDPRSGLDTPFADDDMRTSW